MIFVVLVVTLECNQGGRCWIMNDIVLLKPPVLFSSLNVCVCVCVCVGGCMSSAQLHVHVMYKHKRRLLFLL